MADLKTLLKTSGEVDYIIQDLKTPRGFNRLDTDTMGTCTFTDATRTFTITPVSGHNIIFWANGTYYEKSTAQTVVIPDVSGTYYLYFDANGTLQYALNDTISASDFLAVAITGLVYWNKADAVGKLALDEQHGHQDLGGMTPSSHLHDHLTQGFVWAGGAELTDLVDGSDVYTNTTAGFIFDEDIIYSFALATTHRFMYRAHADGEWVVTTADNNVALMGTTYAQYNEYDSGSSEWVSTECSASTDYVIGYFVVTNFDWGIVKMVGQQTYASRSIARKALRSELHTIQLEGLPSAEISFLYAYIYKADGTVEDDGNGNDYIDLRGQKINAIAD